MKRLQKIINRSKCSVNLMINTHKDYTDSVEEYIAFNDFKDDIDIDVYNKMIELDTIVQLIIYSNSSVGGYCIIHYDIDKALDIGIETLKL